MNIDLMKQVAADIVIAAVPDLGFNMCSWVDEADALNPDMSGHHCGTVACIAGWTIASVKGLPVLQAMYSGLVEAEAADLLDLDEDEADILFRPPISLDWSKATPEIAAKAILNMIETSDPKWHELLPTDNSDD